MAQSNKIPVELLAPARNAEFGKAAINHGADAVYIGASKFGARNAASNTIAETDELIKYAHFFQVKVYAALNTILFDNEVEEAVNIIHQLYNVGIDGIIIQDLGLLQSNLPPVPLIASTQTHNITPGRVHFFEKLGFKRVILARELSLQQISEIRSSTKIELESFIHGAICVSYSGQCYMSEAVCGRSGNRGLCAQPCRSAYDLLDKNKNTLIKDKHLLSQKDLNISHYLPLLLDAGITSFKIEGRLKDIGYVKNITSYYRKQLDGILDNKPDFKKSSEGKIYHFFEPDPERSFNRGFTPYFINGRKEKTGELNTPKSIGKRIGYIIAKGKNWISMDNNILNNADGICYFDSEGTLHGTLVSKTEGDKIYLNSTDKAEIGAEVFRNHDQQFEKMLNGTCATRKIPITLQMYSSETGFVLKATDSNNNSAQVEIACEKQIAQNTDNALHSIHTQLSKFGDTIFELSKLEVETGEVYFIPIRVLNELRRQINNEFIRNLQLHYQPERIHRVRVVENLSEKKISFTGNISNKYARDYLLSLGAEEIEPAFELQNNHLGKVVMTTKYCIKYQLNACSVYQKNQVKMDEPLYLKDQHHLYKLHFDCKRCEMQLILEK